VWHFAGTTDRIAQLRHIVRRETIRLVALTAIAIVVFIVTRELAIRAEQRELRDAAEWYRRGGQLLESDPNGATMAFRRAVMKHRGEKRYTLALADALTRAGNTVAAERALEGLREFSPEDADVNLALARLNRSQREIADALRYYHHAVYGTGRTADQAREVRLELVNMLLDASELTRAQSELIAATVDFPDSRELRLQLAGLFERANNAGRAAEQYDRVLKAYPRDPAAVEGAVRAAFATGNYRRVLGYRLGADASSQTRDLVDIARDVVTRDPLANRLAGAERRRRLLQNIAYLEERWAACGPESRPREPDYPESLVALRAMVRPTSIGRDAEALETALQTIEQLRRQTELRCGTRTNTDRALEIIAALHDIGPA
jgi:hypothetical protein